MNKEFVEELLYKKENKEVLNALDELPDEATLFVFCYNYNWNNGFEIPKKILKNKKCTLSIALLLFFSGDGLNYLMDKKINVNLPEWSDFIITLYEKIVDNTYVTGNVAYKVPLTKIEKFKLLKKISPKEEIFIKSIEGEDAYIQL